METNLSLCLQEVFSSKVSNPLAPVYVGLDNALAYAVKNDNLDRAGAMLQPVYGDAEAEALCPSQVPLFLTSGQAPAARPPSNSINESPRRLVGFAFSPRPKDAPPTPRSAGQVRSESSPISPEDRRRRRKALIYGTLPTETSDPACSSALFGIAAVGREEARRCADVLAEVAFGDDMHCMLPNAGMTTPPRAMGGRPPLPPGSGRLMSSGKRRPPTALPSSPELSECPQEMSFRSPNFFPREDYDDLEAPNGRDSGESAGSVATQLVGLPPALADANNRANMQLVDAQVGWSARHGTGGESSGMAVKNGSSAGTGENGAALGCAGLERASTPTSLKVPIVRNDESTEDEDEVDDEDEEPQGLEDKLLELEHERAATLADEAEADVLALLSSPVDPDPLSTGNTTSFFALNMGEGTGVAVTKMLGPTSFPTPGSAQTQALARPTGLAPPGVKVELLRLSHVLAKEVFGWNALRPAQSKAMPLLIAGRDVLLVLPTGAGKTACFVLPALCCPGLTIVVLPLLALMDDIMAALRALHIPAACLTSKQEVGEQMEILGMVRRMGGMTVEQCGAVPPDPSLPGGRWTWREPLKLLLLTPERLTRSDSLLDALEECAASRTLARIVVDEAHCVTEWGSSWRPDYADLRWLRPVFPSVPITALSATATPQTQEGILQGLGMNPALLAKNAGKYVSSLRSSAPPLPLQMPGAATWPAIVISEPTDRPNLKLVVAAKASKGDGIKLATSYVRSMLERMETEERDKAASARCGSGPLTGVPRGAGLVYCGFKSMVEDVARALMEAGIPAAFYHADVSPEDKASRAEDWRVGRVRVMVATVAFGMGINHAHVRFVLHCTVPSSLSAYSQEVGRAGRDGEPAECLLLYCDADRATHSALARQTFGRSVAELTGHGGEEESGTSNMPPLKARAVAILDAATAASSAGVMHPSASYSHYGTLRGHAWEPPNAGRMRLLNVLAGQVSALEDMCSWAEARAACRRATLSTYFSTGQLPFPKTPSGLARPVSGAGMGPTVISYSGGTMTATASTTMAQALSMGSGSGIDMSMCSPPTSSSCCDYCMYLTGIGAQGGASATAPELYWSEKYMHTVRTAAVWPGPLGHTAPDWAASFIFPSSRLGGGAPGTSGGSHAHTELTELAPVILPPTLATMLSTKRMRIASSLSLPFAILRLDLAAHARMLIAEFAAGPQEGGDGRPKGSGRGGRGGHAGRSGGVGYSGAGTPQPELTLRQAIAGVQSRMAGAVETSVAHAAACVAAQEASLDAATAAAYAMAHGEDKYVSHGAEFGQRYEQDVHMGGGGGGRAPGRGLTLAQLEAEADAELGLGTLHESSHGGGRGRGGNRGRAAPPRPASPLSPSSLPDHLPPSLPDRVWLALGREMVRRGVLLEKHSIAFQGRIDSRVTLAEGTVLGLTRSGMSVESIRGAVREGGRNRATLLPRVPSAVVPAFPVLLRCVDMGAILHSGSPLSHSASPPPDKHEEGLLLEEGEGPRKGKGAKSKGKGKGKVPHEAGSGTPVPAVRECKPRQPSPMPIQLPAAKVASMFERNAWAKAKDAPAPKRAGSKGKGKGVSAKGGSKASSSAGPSKSGAGRSAEGSDASAML